MHVTFFGPDNLAFRLLVFFLLFFSGAAWGSFLGVVADRIPRKESILFPPSHCHGCNKTLTIRDLIPLFSWIRGHGKCRHCLTPIDPQTLLSELMTGGFFILLGFLFLQGTPSSGLIKLFLYGSFSIPLSLIDIRHLRLPHILTIPALATGLAFSFIAPDASISNSFEGAAAALLVLAPIAYFKPHALGMGDALFLGAIGSFTSPMGILITLIIASGTALITSLSWLVWERLHRRNRSVRDLRIPFGPFLAVGGGAVIILALPEIDLLSRYFQFSASLPPSSTIFLGSSEKLMGELWFREIAKGVVQGDFHGFIGPKIRRIF